MARIHFILQGKGGVGKSVTASLLAQHKAERGEHPLCIDTDPANATFHGYKALQAKLLSITDQENEIDPRNFDVLVELIANAENDDVIIDNGASSFMALSRYLVSNQVPDLLLEMGHEVIVHSVITGGQALVDTIHGFDALASQYPEDVKFVVWLNPYWGAIEFEGKSFEKMAVYKTHKDRIVAIIKIPELKKEFAGRDFSEMLQARKTFNEAIDSPELTIMTRQRLKLVKKQIFEQLDLVTGII